MSLLRHPNGELTALGWVARKGGLGRLAYQVYRRPLDWARRRALPDRPVEVPLFGYTFHAPSPRRNPLSGDVYRTGVWEPPVTAAAAREIRPGDGVLDVGADLGYYVLLAASRNRGGAILAFEPNPGHQEFLARNVAANGLLNARVVQAGLGNVTGDLRFRPDEARLDPAAGPGAGGITVPVHRYDDLPAEAALARVDFVLIDVEGAELEVLKGMERALLRDRPRLLVEVHGPFLPHFGTTKPDLLGWVAARGYAAEWVGGDPLSGPGLSHVLFRPAPA